MTASLTETPHVWTVDIDNIPDWNGTILLTEDTARAWGEVWWHRQYHGDDTEPCGHQLTWRPFPSTPSAPYGYQTLLDNGELTDLSIAPTPTEDGDFPRVACGTFLA